VNCSDLDQNYGAAILRFLFDSFDYE